MQMKLSKFMLYQEPESKVNEVLMIKLEEVEKSINQVFVYLRKNPSDTDMGGVYNRIKK